MSEQSTIQQEELETAQNADTVPTTGGEVETPVNIASDSAVEVDVISEEEASYPSPKGAFVFVIMMLIFYVVYWFVAYFEIFVLRGA